METLLLIARLSHVHYFLIVSATTCSGFQMWRWSALIRFLSILTWNTSPTSSRREDLQQGTFIVQPTPRVINQMNVSGKTLRWWKLWKTIWLKITNITNSVILALEALMIYCWSNRRYRHSSKSNWWGNNFAQTRILRRIIYWRRLDGNLLSVSYNSRSCQELCQTSWLTIPRPLGIPFFEINFLSQGNRDERTSPSLVFGLYGGS